MTTARPGLPAPFSRPTGQPVAVSAVLDGAASCLFVVFAISALTLFLPLDPTNPTWQLRVVGGVIQAAPLALVGFLLLHGAAHLDPERSRYTVRLATARQRALVAALGFVLLVPLQATALWTLFTADADQLAQRRASTEATFVALRSAVGEATTPQELQREMRVLRGPAINDQQLDQPIAALRTQTLRNLDRTQAVMDQKLRGPDQKGIIELVQNGIRIGVSGLAFAFAFALGALQCRPASARRCRSVMGVFSRPRSHDLVPSRVPASSVTTRR